MLIAEVSVSYRINLTRQKEALGRFGESCQAGVRLEVLGVRAPPMFLVRRVTKSCGPK